MQFISIQLTACARGSIGIGNANKQSWKKVRERTDGIIFSNVARIFAHAIFGKCDTVSRLCNTRARVRVRSRARVVLKQPLKTAIYVRFIGMPLFSGDVTLRV